MNEMDKKVDELRPLLQDLEALMLKEDTKALWINLREFEVKITSRHEVKCPRCGEYGKNTYITTDHLKVCKGI